MKQDIYSSAIKFLASLTVQETYKLIVEEAMKLVDGKYGTIFLPSSEGGMQRVYASTPLLYKIVPRKNGITNSVFKTGKPYLFNEAYLLPIHPELRKLGIGSDISIPLTYNEVTVGVLSVMSPKNKTLAKKDVEILSLFSPLATLAIRKALLHEQLSKSLEARDLFISIASHELKTPLTSIILHTEMLAKNVSKGEMPSREDVDKLLSEELRFSKLIKELLQVNQIKTGGLAFNMERCRLSEIINHAIGDISYIFKDRRINFHNELKNQKTYIIGDYDKLLQVIINLLNNAVKYSKTGSPIDVALKYKSPNYVLKIKDQGIGITKKDIPYIFERFYQGKNYTSGGMGLGLYLVKHIIDSHNGQIKVESKFREGTTFTISLPKEN